MLREGLRESEEGKGLEEYKGERKEKAANEQAQVDNNK